MKTLQIKISAELAEEYFHKHQRAFPMRSKRQVSIERLIADLVEDQICEEIKFLDAEIQSG